MLFGKRNVERRREEKKGGRVRGMRHEGRKEKSNEIGTYPQRLKSV